MTALALAVISVSLTAHAMWFDRPKGAGRSPWLCRCLYAGSWACIGGALVTAVAA